MRPLGTIDRQDGPCACCDRNGRHICQRALKKKARQKAKREVEQELARERAAKRRAG